MSKLSLFFAAAKLGDPPKIGSVILNGTGSVFSLNPNRGNITKNVALGSGFVLLFALYGYIYMNFMYGKYHFDNVLIFGAFLVFWSLYGVVYMLGDDKEEEKNIGYNILDLFSKCFVGIFFWAYFTGVFVLK